MKNKFQKQSIEEDEDGISIPAKLEDMYPFLSKDELSSNNLRLMKKAVIITGNLVQDHEFIYPYYRLLEEGINVDVCILEGKPVVGILGTAIPPNKDQKVKKIEDLNLDDYEILVIPGGVKQWKK